MNSIKKQYEQIIDDVCKKLKDQANSGEFSAKEEGIQKLQELWKQKLNEATTLNSEKNQQQQQQQQSKETLIQQHNPPQNSKIMGQNSRKKVKQEDIQELSQQDQQIKKEEEESEEESQKYKLVDKGDVNQDNNLIIKQQSSNQSSSADQQTVAQLIRAPSTVQKVKNDELDKLFQSSSSNKYQENRAVEEEEDQKDDQEETIKGVFDKFLYAQKKASNEGEDSSQFSNNIMFGYYVLAKMNTQKHKLKLCNVISVINGEEKFFKTIEGELKW